MTRVISLFLSRVFSFLSALVEHEKRASAAAEGEEEEEVEGPRLDGN